jgi:hypothetical protein
VVLFLDGPGELRTAPETLCEGASRAKEQVNAGREVCGMEQGSTPLPYQCRDPGKILAPAGRAGDGWEPDPNQTFQIDDSGLGPGKLEGHIRSRHPLGRQGTAPGVFNSVDHGVHGVASLPGQCLDRPAHFAMSNNGNPHWSPPASRRTPQCGR